MKPVYQAVYGEGKGDCYRACLASILECPIDDFPLPPDGEFLTSFYDESVAAKGFYMVWLVESDGIIPPGYSIAGCPVDDSENTHAVVCFGGEMVHDPNKYHLDTAFIDGGGFVFDQGKVMEWGVLIPFDPVRRDP
jgi:hypothetical protein